MEKHIAEIEITQLENKVKQLPFYEVGVVAGFPSPATDHEEQTLNLHELLIEHPAATFFVRVKGDSMKGAHISDGDLLIVDRAKTASSGKIVVALLEGEFTVKRLMKKGKLWYLVAENSAYPAIAIDEEKEFQIWGVVTYVIHRTS